MAAANGIHSEARPLAKNAFYAEEREEIKSRESRTQNIYKEALLQKPYNQDPSFSYMVSRESTEVDMIRKRGGSIGFLSALRESQEEEEALRMAREKDL